MGKINQGILGGVAGKVGPVVGSRWKGIQYLRGYVIPSNPKTTPQVEARTAFALASSYASQFLYRTVQPYADKVAVKMSGFNLVTQISLDIINETTSKEFTPTLAGISAGPVDPVVISDVEYNAPDVNVFWEPTAAQVGSGDDLVNIYVVAYDSGKLVTFGTPVARTVGEVSIAVPEAYAANTYTIVAVAHRGDGTIDQAGSYSSAWGITPDDLVAKLYTADRAYSSF